MHAHNVIARGSVESGLALLACAINDVAELADRAQPSDWASRSYRAFMLATDIDVYEALMRGEAVQLERLDAEWVDRLGFTGSA